MVEGKLAGSEVGRGLGASTEAARQDELAEKVHQIMTGPNQTERLGKDKDGHPVMVSWDGYRSRIRHSDLPRRPAASGATYPGKPGTGPAR